MDMGGNKLAYSLKTLRTHWDETSAGWNDQVRQDFEDGVLAPLERQVNATIRGMHQLAEVFKKMRQDCSEEGGDY